MAAADDKRHQQAVDCLQTRIAVLEERVRNRDEAMTTALTLQAREYERRLDELNHAHAQAVQKNADYLPREVFEASIKENLEWRRGVDQKLSEATGSRTAYVAVLALLMALGSLAVAFFQ